MQPKTNLSSKPAPPQKKGEAPTAPAEPDNSESHPPEEDLKHCGPHFHHAHTKETLETLGCGVAHDFNNILTCILGSTEAALLKTQKQVAVPDELEAVLTAATRGKEIVQQFLHFDRLQVSEKHPISFHAIAQETLHLFRATVPANIEIRENLVTDSDVVLADPTQIHQSLMNLLVNAGDAMCKGPGVLECRLELVEVTRDFMRVHPSIKPGPYLKLMVQDTGEGIAPDVLERIFDPFFTTKRKGEGIGMGLATAQRIITNHGGTITVESSQKEGTTVAIFLPQLAPVSR